MKKGVLISGIITIALYSILASVFAIVGIVSIATKSMADSDPGSIPVEELVIVATVFLILAGYFLFGIIFAGIMIGKRTSAMGKGAGVALGIFGVIFGAIVPGIFFVADSAKTRS